jgi:tetratricopeptide (TPR) repeat protein
MNIHPFKCTGVLACLAVLFFSCQKKTESEEKRLAQQEAASPLAVLPEANWNRTIAIFEPQGQSPIEKALFREFVRDFTSRLSAVRFVRVALWPSRTALADTALAADATLDCRVRVRDSGTANWFLSIKKSGRSDAVWEFSPESPLQEVYGLSRRAAAQAALEFGIDTAVVIKKDVPPLTASLFGRYLEGRICLGEKTREKLGCAVRNFKEVLKTDSTLIQAWEGLADSYLDNFRNRWDVNRVWVQLAQDAAFRAMRLDSTRGDVRFLLAQVYVQWGDLRTAERETRRALELDPNLADAWSLLGDLAVQSRGQYDLALESYGRSLSLSPASIEAAAGESLVQMGLGRYADASRTLETALRTHPDEARLHSSLALAYHYQHSTTDALAEIRKGLDSEDVRPFSSAVFAMILASTGNLDGALEEVTLRVEPYAGGNAPLCTSVAAVYSLLKRNGLAVQWLEKAVSLGYRDFIWLSSDPNFDGMRQDQRFIELMRQIKTEWRKNLAGG